MGNSTTPIWLDMRTEYIDVNFEKFVDYLYANKNNTNDSFYTLSIDLLMRRVDEIITLISSEQLSKQDSTLSEGEEKERLMLWVRLLGLYVLVEEQPMQSHAKRAFVYQLLLLAKMCSADMAEKLVDFALNILINSNVLYIGYTWNDIRQFYPEILATKIISYAKCEKANCEEKWFEGNGCAKITGQKLQILNIQDRKSVNDQQESIAVSDGRVVVMSPQSKKLKQSQQQDLLMLSSFTKEYILSMTPTDLHLGEKQLKRYFIDHEQAVEVRITDVSYDSIYAVTVDKDYYPLKGHIEFKNTLYFSITDLIKNWRVGDELPCRITDIDTDGRAVFDITDEFVSFIVNERVKEHDLVRGVVTKVVNGQHTMWLTDLGVPMFTQYEQYEIGIVADLEVTEVCQNGYIKCLVDNEVGSSDFDTYKYKYELLRSYCYEPQEDSNDVAAQTAKRLEYSDIRAAMMCLYLQQKVETVPIEKYRILSVLQIMSKLVGDNVTESFIGFLTQYLSNVICFAKGHYSKMFVPEVSDTDKDDVSVKRRMDILEVLRCYGKEGCEDVLEKAVDNNDQAISHLAKVIQSCNRLQGVLSDAMRNAILHELLKMLKISDDTAADLEEEGGAYLGIENGHQEFKTSIVFPPDYNMQPAPEVQKMNVFKAVCAFLNSESGGVVYLGVNDLGMVTGLDADLQYLKKNLDGYMRYITDEAKAEFGLGVLTFIDIQVMYDERVVAISVKPCDYKVVELAGKAYIRTNAESREMPKSVRLRIEDRRLTYDKHRAESVSSLQTAIDNRRQVIAHGYSSSHGGDKRDRRLEPFAFTNGKKDHVWCYELDDKMVKLFSVTRMSNVEILDKEWQASQYHKEGNIDIFYMTGNDNIKVCLELDRMAYNLILEEYPESKRYLEDTHSDSWILKTTVCSIYGIGRFYIGLADHITILDAPELEKLRTAE